MTYRAAEKLEIIRLDRTVVVVGTAHLGATRDSPAPRSIAVTNAIWRAAPGPWEMASRRRVWNKLPEKVVAAVIELALQEPGLSQAGDGVCRPAAILRLGSLVYRLWKARGLITSPAFILLKAADHFAPPTTSVNQLWQLILVVTSSQPKFVDPGTEAIRLADRSSDDGACAMHQEGSHALTPSFAGAH